MWNHNNNNNNGTNQGGSNNNNNNQNNSAVPNPTDQDLQLFLSCLHQVAVAQISQWHDSLQATLAARGVGSSSNNSNNNRTNNNNPQQNNSAKAKTSDKSATTKKKNRKERKESSGSSSSSSSDSESEDLIWVDGDKEFEVPKKQLKENGSPYFGWAFCLVNNRKNKTKTKAYHYCMGCMTCPEENCNFKARPLWPSIKWKGAPPKMPKELCMTHKCDLVWIPCTGNKPEKTKTGDPMPCTLNVTIEDGKSKKVTAIHKGNHDSHPRPPLHKPSPAAMKTFTKIVKTNPEAGAAKLIMGTRTRQSVTGLSEAFHNIDRVGKKKRQILQNKMRAFGIRGSIGGLFELSADIPSDFIVECSFP